MKAQSHEVRERIAEPSGLARLAVVLFATGLALLIAGLVTR